MSPQEISTLRNRGLSAFQIALLFLFLAVCMFGIVSSANQVPQGDTAVSAQEERELKNTVPDHVPIKIKIKNEKSFKDKKNKGWAREFELEVKNTGDKPIYFLLINIDLPDVAIDGIPYALQLYYGRMELFRLTTPIQSDDVPIRPGETVTISIPAKQIIGYEYCRDHECGTDAKKVELYFALINFGDGTGLRGTDGQVAPKPQLQN
jgi:hypothetical protein